MSSLSDDSAVIIGTAGHIDHGKTTLVRALTGTDCDRLDEEKRRGITIVLGFASLVLPCGRPAGIVDVPGHEKFVRTMVAGAGGVDVALLVVSAEEGVMPQTREHLAILEVLAVPQLVVALTRSDAVEDELLELAELDVRGLLEDSRWPEAEVFAVSGLTGAGQAELLAGLSAAASCLPRREQGSLFRLPVDRSFSIRGFGTVVTGTARDGRVAVGDTLEVLPARRKVRVRGLQVHGETTDEAFMGTRVALNLQGIDPSVVAPGCWLATPGALAGGDRVDVELHLLDDAPRAIANNSRVRFLYGTAELVAIVRLIDGDGGAAPDELLPGDSGLAQLALPEPLGFVAGDRFVLRAESPMETLGGGRILDPEPPGLDRRSRVDAAELLVRLSDWGADLEAKAVALLRRHRASSMDVLAMRRRLPPGGQSVEEAAAAAVASGQAVVVPADRPSWTWPGVVAWWAEDARACLAQHHAAHPLLEGASLSELRAVLEPQPSDRVIEALVSALCVEAGLEQRGHLLALPEHQPVPDASARSVLDELVRRLGVGGVHPPPLSEAGEGLSLPPDALHWLVSQGELIRVSEDYLVEREAYRNLVRVVVAHVRAKGSLSPVEFKEITGLTRRHAIPFLEFLDREKITTRTAGGRALRDLPDWAG